MRLGKGHRTTLVQMGLDPDKPTVRQYGRAPVDHSVPDSALVTFFTFVDTGIRPNRPWTDIEGELLALFKIIAVNNGMKRSDAL